MLESCGVRAPAPTRRSLSPSAQRVLLTHGDALCLDDVDYQRFRAMVRSPAWQARARALPLAERRARSAAQHARRSDSARSRASAGALGRRRCRRRASRWLRAADAPTLVHGHTHAPASHALAPGLVRHVLSDWELDGSSAPRAEVLRWTRARLRAHRAGRRPASAARRDRGWLAPLARARAHARAPRAIPDALWQLTLARFPFLAARGAADLRRAARAWRRSSSPRRSSAARAASTVTDEMAVAIAAQACLPVLQLGLRLATTASSASSCTPTRSSRGARSMDDDGVVHDYDEELAGEAMERRPGDAVLARRATTPASRPTGGYNVVIHEFAHVLDMRDGVSRRRRRRCRPASERRRWLNVLDDEYEALLPTRSTRGEETLLDPYGAEALEEFFAVARGGVLRRAAASCARAAARSTSCCASFFRQDPARALSQ